MFKTGHHRCLVRSDDELVDDSSENECCCLKINDEIDTAGSSGVDFENADDAFV